MITCSVCDRSVRLVIEIEGTHWCNACYERVNPITVQDQIRWARRRFRTAS